jgi:hypothetical protein
VHINTGNSGTIGKIEVEIDDVLDLFDRISGLIWRFIAMNGREEDDGRLV